MNLIRVIAAWLLNLIPADQPLGTRLFNAIAKHTVGIAIETVLLHRNKETGELEVYMTLRGAGEAYANQWHVPGSYVRSGECLEDVLKRLGKEYRTEIVYSSFLGDKFMPEERFKTILDRVYLIGTKGEPSNPAGHWWPVAALPENTVDAHRDYIIPLATAKIMSPP